MVFQSTETEDVFTSKAACYRTQRTFVELFPDWNRILNNFFPDTSCPTTRRFHAGTEETVFDDLGTWRHVDRAPCSNQNRILSKFRQDTFRRTSHHSQAGGPDSRRTNRDKFYVTANLSAWNECSMFLILFFILPCDCNRTEKWRTSFSWKGTLQEIKQHFHYYLL